MVQPHHNDNDDDSCHPSVVDGKANEIDLPSATALGSQETSLLHRCFTAVAAAAVATVTDRQSKLPRAVQRPLIPIKPDEASTSLLAFHHLLRSTADSAEPRRVSSAVCAYNRF